MKFIMLALFTLFSLQSFPGDKGNLAIEIMKLDTTSLERLLVMSLDVADELFEPLAKRELSVLENGRITGNFVSLISELITRKEVEVLEGFIFSNDEFYSAFQKTTPESEQRLKIFWSEVVRALKTKLTTEEIDSFISQIDSKRLGYGLSNL